MSDSTQDPPAADIDASEASPMTSEFADTLAEMRRTLASAPLIATYTAARVAIQVRTDADIVLSHLAHANETFFHSASEEEIGREGVIVKLKIASWLAARRDERRSAEERLADYRHQAEQAQRLLGADDEQVRSFWESFYLDQARDPEQYSDAKAAYRASLEARGLRFPTDDIKPWHPPLNFRLSLASQNFATILRRSPDPADVRLAERITERNAQWRRAQYSALHPFTMVAEGNRLLTELYHAEAAQDGSETDDAARTNTQSILRDAVDLAAARQQVLGEHHGATVKAQSYQARALRLLGEHYRARAVAEEALAHYLAYGRADDTVSAILRLIVAEGYVAEATAAHANLEVAFVAGAVLVADDERDRARALWQRASVHLAMAEQHLLRWPNQGVWLPRVAAIRARRNDAGYGDVADVE